MIRFFIHQYKAVNLLVAVVILAGVYTFIEGRKEGFPVIGLDLITITTSYPGASADTIEQLITEKIEDMLTDLEGAGKIKSYSSEGRSIIQFEVDPDAGRDNAEILAAIQTAMDSIEFPAEASDPLIREISFGRSTVILLAGFVGDLETEELKALARQFEKDAKNIPGVSRVKIINYPELQVWVEIDPTKLKRYDLEITSVVQAIRAHNLNLSAGLIKYQNEEFFIKTSIPYTSLSSIENTIIRSNNLGKTVRLFDIASVHYGHEQLASYRRSDGRSGVWLRIYKNASSDTIEVANRVQKLLAEYETNGSLPPHVTTTVGDDISFYIKRRLGVLTSNATAGLLFVFLIMILFFNARITFWTILGIPFSFCLGIITTYALGMTLNLMTMFGLIIVVGMIVDDAIIIAENIYVYVEKGYSYYDAAILGTKEMLVPVIAITATTTLAFLPLITLPGIYGKVLSSIPKIVIITMLCSLFECIFILPGHLAHIKKKAHPDKKFQGTQKKDKNERRWFEPVTRIYGILLTRLLRYPVMVALLFLSFLGVATYTLAKDLPYVFFPGRAQSMVVNIETAIGNSIEDTIAVMDQTEERIREATSDGTYVVAIVSTIGQNSSRGEPRYQSHLGYIRISLDTARTEKDSVIAATIEKAVAKVPGIVTYKMRQRRGGPGSGSSPIEVYVTGNSLAQILPATQAIEDFLRQLPNTHSVASSYETGKKEIVVIPDEKAAAELRVDLFSIGNAIRYAFAEIAPTTVTTLTDIPEKGHEIDIIVKYSEAASRSLDNITETPVANLRGYMIPVSNVAALELVTSSSQLIKEDGELYISVSSDLKNRADKEYGANKLLSMIEKEFPSWQEQYSNVRFSLRGEKEEEDELNVGIRRALALAAFSIFFVLTIIFRSYTQALVVISIIPLGFAGIIIGLALTGTPLGMMPFLGGVALMGIVVNDSLVMVDKINRLRRNENMALLPAVIAGATSRLRPIIMTSITTIVGIAPLAYGFLGEEPFLAPMGVALMWGLIASTFLLLILLPIFYLLMERCSAFFTHLWAVLFRHNKENPRQLH